MAFNDETVRKAFEIYQRKYGGTLVEISILFVNVMNALEEAAKQPEEEYKCLACGHIWKKSECIRLDGVLTCGDAFCGANCARVARLE